MVGQNALHNGGPTESEAKTQRQGIIALCVFLALLFLVWGALGYAKVQGLLQAIPQYSPAPWPLGWP